MTTHFDPKRLVLLAPLLAPLLVGCYSDSWKDALGGDCEAGALRCTESGVDRCVDGMWTPDRSNVGCEFAAASFPQGDDANTVSIGLANSGLRPANVNLTVAGTSVGAIQVLPGSSSELPLPWNAALGGATTSGVVLDATVMVASDEPISAFQYNHPGSDSPTSDGSLLLPSHVWGSDYYALTHPHFVSPLNGMEDTAFWAALSLTDASLEVVGSPTASVVGGSVFDAMGSGNVGLSAGDAAIVITQSGGEGPTACGWNSNINYYACGAAPNPDPSGTYPHYCGTIPVAGTACSGVEAFIGCCGGDGFLYYCTTTDAGQWVQEDCPALYDASDLSGSHVTGDAPFAFFSGHGCTNVPSYVPYCDHLEEQFWPADRATSQYPVVAPTLDGTARGHVVRILATQGAVDLTYDPPVTDAPTSIAGAGEFVDLLLGTASFVLEASGPVQVVQLSGGSTILGDPSMLTVPSASQGLTEMGFHVPLGFDTLGVTFVTAAENTGTTVEIDGNSATLQTELGASFVMTRVSIPQSANGFHRITADVPVIATVFVRNTAAGTPSTMWFSAGTAEPE